MNTLTLAIPSKGRLMEQAAGAPGNARASRIDARWARTAAIVAS